MVANKFKALPPPFVGLYGKRILRQWKETRELPLPQAFRDTVIRTLRDAGLNHSSKSFDPPAFSEAFYSDIGLWAFEKDTSNITYRGNTSLQLIEIRRIENGRRDRPSSNSTTRQASTTPRTSIAQGQTKTT